MEFTLKDDGLAFCLKNVQDPQGRLKTIGWQNLPLITCADREYRYWRLSTKDPNKRNGAKMEMVHSDGQIKSAETEDDPASLIHGCAWRPHKLCVFVHSNYPLFPVIHQVTADNKYAIGLNTYQYRIRNKTMRPLEARVVLCRDINGDDRADQSDYGLWVNRQLPDADPIYHTHSWYKIFLSHPDPGILTTFKQAREIVEAIYNVTDGLPQIVYLVGWQYDGHDTGYPAMDKVNTAVGGEADLRELSRVCKERFNTIISYHCNIDDQYPDREAFDPTTQAAGGISHCLDAESGKIFKRLEAMMRVAPEEKTIHFDNVRITSIADGVGIMEELECGLRPISDYLKAKGITMTTEGQNGMPIDCSPFFSGFWHVDYPSDATASGVFPPMKQMWHRKIMGGGLGRGAGHRYELGLGWSLHQDISYLTHTSGIWLSFTENWPDIVDGFYLGNLLYQFY